MSALTPALRLRPPPLMIRLVASSASPFPFAVAAFPERLDLLVFDLFGAFSWLFPPSVGPLLTLRRMAARCWLKDQMRRRANRVWERSTDRAASKVGLLPVTAPTASRIWSQFMLEGGLSPIAASNMAVSASPVHLAPAAGIFDGLSAERLGETPLTNGRFRYESWWIKNLFMNLRGFKDDIRRCWMNRSEMGSGSRGGLQAASLDIHQLLFERALVSGGARIILYQRQLSHKHPATLAFADMPYLALIYLSTAKLCWIADSPLFSLLNVWIRCRLRTAAGCRLLHCPFTGPALALQ